MTTQATERLVVDATVVAKWYLNDEDDVERARLVFAAFAAKQLLLAAPEQLRYEISNALTVATRTTPPRLTPRQAEAAIADFLRLPVPTFTDDQLITSAYHLAQHHGIAFYDALYLAVAERLGIRFITADRRLYCLTSQRTDIVWLAEWSPS